MYYEINVAKNGQHYFATSERSISTKEKAKELFDKLSESFPESDGYNITVSRWEHRGENIKF
jgi:hypothetical protein